MRVLVLGAPVFFRCWSATFAVAGVGVMLVGPHAMTHRKLMRQVNIKNEFGKIDVSRDKASGQELHKFSTATVIQQGHI